MKKRALLSSMIAIAIIIPTLSGCAQLYGVFAPGEYKAVDDAEYPEDAIPLYDGAVIYDYEADEDSITLKAGSRDDFSDVADYYMDEFEDDDYVINLEKDRSNEYITEGYRRKYSFELVAETPDDKWEKRLYNTVISIDITISSLGNKDELEDYINSVKEDLDVVSEVFSDKDSLQNTNMDMKGIYDFISSLYDTVVEQKTEIEQHTPPDLPQLQSLHQSEIVLYGQVEDILEEYTQMLSYATTLMEMGDLLIEAGAVQSQNLDVIYSTLSDAINNVISLLEGAHVPSFMQSFNDRYLEVFYQMNDAVYYTLSAADMLDPVRLDAAEYSMDILNRESEKLSVTATEDTEDRNAKIDGDIENIRGVIGDWQDWLDGALEAIASNADALDPLPEELFIDGEDVVINCSVQTPDHIIPANYRSLDYVAFIEAWTNRGTAEALVTVEIPGFTQAYEQKITLNRAEYELVIHPPLLADAAETLNSSREAQIIITIEDLSTGELVLQESRNVTLYSRYDMQWVDDNGIPYYENILAWMTPEAPQIKQLLRDAADSAEYLTGGALDSIVGYQYAVDASELKITYYQAAAIMHALASTEQVKYVMTPFSSTDTSLQRIATPAEVISHLR